MLTLIADIPSVAVGLPIPRRYFFRPCVPSDIPGLASLYFASYDPGVAGASLAEAEADMEAAFSGAYGELWPEASQVAVAQEGQLVAAIQVVRCAPWTDTPRCPFVIELFTSRDHRRCGLASALVRGAMDVLAGANQVHLALRVDADNGPALSLYHRLGFRTWNSAGDSL